MRPSLPVLLFAAILAGLPVVRATDEPPLLPHFVERAEKIVAGLGLTDANQANRVRDQIAGQYHALSQVHDARDAAIKAVKDFPDAWSEAVTSAIEAARETAAARQSGLHYAYLATLSVELTPEQVEKVKDGMTYGVVPLTFRVYQEMLPDLAPEQSQRILAWLREAREHAMDAGSSDEKHGWFGKYKGRINNYLAAAGIDMKKAEQDMMDRKKKAPVGK